MRPRVIVMEAVIACLLAGFLTITAQRVPSVPSAEDLLQDQRINQIDDHLRSTDDALLRQATQIAQLQVDIAGVKAAIDGLENENRAWFAVMIAIISGGGIAIWFRTRH